MLFKHAQYTHNLKRLAQNAKGEGNNNCVFVLMCFVNKFSMFWMLRKDEPFLIDTKGKGLVELDQNSHSSFLVKQNTN